MIIYLAGVLNLSKYIFEEGEIDKYKDDCYILESFFYCRKYADKVRMWDKEHFLLDSGAFTFKYNKREALDDWWKYIDEYCDFIINNDVKYFFELDIDNVVGYEKVKEFRRYIENKTQRPCIPVWHISRGKEDFIETCKNYKYIAVGGITGKEVKKTRSFIEGYLDALIKIAHSYGAKIHLLGYTTSKNLSKHHCDSVDSTSWTSGGRFGAVYQFRDGKMNTLKIETRKRLNAYRSHRHNFQEWYKYQKWAKEKI